MKKLLILLCLLISLKASAQTSVCGVPFGSSKESSSKMLQNKFGSADYISFDSIIYQSKTYAGLYWDYLWFSFQFNSKGDSFFNGAIFSTIYNSYKDAMNYYSKVKLEFSKTYHVSEDYPDDGKYATHCFAFKSRDDAIGVKICVKREHSETDIFTYSVEVFYFGPDYVKETL